MYVLTNISQDVDGAVYAGQATIYENEEAAILSAREQLADDFGITLEDIDNEAWEGGTPYVLSLSNNGRFEAYTVSKLPDCSFS